jgi:mRNA-degrading endonuclease RelE of RelBE toxin-antitoxin system
MVAAAHAAPFARGRMYQVNFSDQAMRILAKLPTLEQLEVVEAFSALTPEALLEGRSDLGSVRREGHTYHRLRIGEYRIYFEAKEGSLMAHYVLHRHTFADFAFRSHLPFGDDESRIEQEGGFWKYLDDPKR